jgi:predicted O-methyltransferase YrrM
MDRDERVASYIDSLRPDGPGYLKELEEYAYKNDIPIIRPAMRDLIRSILTMHKPMAILEIGTAIGFSALYMREYAPAGAHITTIENYPPRIEEAKKNLAAYDPTGQITLIEGDAVEIVAGMTGIGDDPDSDNHEMGPDTPGAISTDEQRNIPMQYDMIFMDGPKGQYLGMYEEVKKLLVTGGVLLSDNIFKDGEILESRYAVNRRERTIHARMREYLHRLTHDEDYTTSILPLADGVAISVRT